MSYYVFKNILIINSLFPIFGIFVLFFVKENKPDVLKKIALNFSFMPFILSLFLWTFFENSFPRFQYLIKISWVPVLNFDILYGIDGISIFFVLLTTFLIPLCLLVSWNVNLKNLKSYLILFLLIEFLLINVFCVLDIFVFYVFFEGVLIPMFLIIGIWGSRERKVLAAYYFFIYTLLGSVLLLLSIIYIYYQAGSTNYEFLLTFKFSFFEQKVLWSTFFLAFASKVPMMPFHLWLPEAHVEAPTSGSVILAGVLLKLGSYGFIRFSLPLFPEASFFFAPYVYTIATIGIVYSSLTAIRQTDFKRIIAYTSIAHMNVVIIGIFSFNVLGIEGAIVQSISHGFVASAFFVLIGVVYERYKTRLVKYYGGLVITMPMYVTILLFFTMANIGFPGTSGFIGEFLIFAGSFKVHPSVTFLGATGVILSGCYSLWLLNRICFGNLKTQYLFKTVDLNKRELIIFIPLIVYTLILGIFPNCCLNSLHISTNSLIERFFL